MKNILLGLLFVLLCPALTGAQTPQFAYLDIPWQTSEKDLLGFLDAKGYSEHSSSPSQSGKEVNLNIKEAGLEQYVTFVFNAKDELVMLSSSFDCPADELRQTLAVIKFHLSQKYGEPEKESEVENYFAWKIGPHDLSLSVTSPTSLGLLYSSAFYAKPESAGQANPVNGAQPENENGNPKPAESGPNPAKGN